MILCHSLFIPFPGLLVFPWPGVWSQRKSGETQTQPWERVQFPNTCFRSWFQNGLRWRGNPQCWGTWNPVSVTVGHADGKTLQRAKSNEPQLSPRYPELCAEQHVGQCGQLQRGDFGDGRRRQQGAQSRASIFRRSDASNGDGRPGKGWSSK